MVPPTGSVSFADTGNQFPLGTQSLGAATGAVNFGTESDPATGNGAPYVTVEGDFNNDGKMDLAVANVGSATVGLPISNGITVLLGNGDGTFSVGSTNSMPVQGNFVAGDFNNDGNLDLAVLTPNVEPSNGITLLFGNGNGTFSTGSGTLSFGSLPTYVAAGDFNGDGNLDLAVTLPTNYPGIAIMLGQGDGTFSATPTPFPGTDNLDLVEPSYLAVADFNGDGISDLAVLNTGRTVSVLTGSPSGELELYGYPGSLGSPQSGEYGNPIAVGDFNGDGKTDFAVLTSGANDALTVEIYLNGYNGTYGFYALPTSTFTVDSTVPGTASIVAADFNGDGKTDLAASDDQQIAIFLSKGDGTFTPSVHTTNVPSGPEGDFLAVGDFNNDGIPDLAIADTNLTTMRILPVLSTETATATLANLSIPGTGIRNVVANYAGNTVFGASSSSSIPVNGSPIGTALSLSASANTSSFGQQLMLSATLNPSSDQNLTTNGETVTFAANGTPIGAGTLASGVATLNITSLPAGTDSLTASYPGDQYFAAAASSSASVSVALPTLTLASTSTGLTVSSSGGSATAPIQLSGPAGFSGTVNFSCSVVYKGAGTATDLPTCSLNPAQAQLSSGTPVSTTVTVSTTAGGVARLGSGPFAGKVAEGSALAMVLIFVAPRRRRRGAALLVVLFGLAIAVAAIGCGGGNSSAGSTGGTTSGATAGTYQVTVTASIGSSSSSLTIPLTVQ
jgi:hypothetical protein